MNTEFKIKITSRAIFERLQNEANNKGIDINSLIVSILKKSLGLEKHRAKDKTYSDLDFLAGTWSSNDYSDFLSNTSGFNKIDEELWK